MVVGIKKEEKSHSKQKRMAMINPAQQEIPSSIFLLRIFPAKRDPPAIPKAHKRNKYPPAYSERCSD